MVRSGLDARYGHLAEVRLVTLLLAAPLLWNVARRRDGGRAEAGVVGVAVLASWASVSHASAGNDLWLAIPLMTLHLAAVSVWFGGLIVLGGFLLHRPDEATLARVLPRWARLATAAVAVMTATGIYLTWREVGTPPALTGTSYGRYLLVKLGLFAVVMGAAWTAHRWVVATYRPVAHAAGPATALAETGDRAASRSPSRSVRVGFGPRSWSK